MKPAKEPLGLLVFDVARLLQRRLEQRLAATGLDITVGEVRTLSRIAETEGLRQSALAERLHVEPMTLVGFLDRLERRGLIERVPDPADRRAKLVRSGAAAAPLMARVNEVIDAVREEMNAGLGRGEAGELRRLLRSVKRSLGAGEGDRDGRPVSGA